MKRAERGSAIPSGAQHVRTPGMAQLGGEEERTEAIGRVAARIAHDLNNLLMVIRSESELATLDIDEDHPAREALVNLREAVDRATAFSARLLALNPRKRYEDTAVTDLNALVARVGELLTGPASGEPPSGVSVQTHCAAEPLVVRFRSDRATQVLRELVANACEAMPSGGHLHVATAAAEVDATSAGVHRTAPGSFAVLSVSDTGDGLSQEVEERLFEPFLTTKAKAEHVGLGLATSFAVVRRVGGWIEVRRGERQGTTVVVYLPRAADGTAEGAPDQ